MSDDPIDHLLPEDREWLTAHGWKDPNKLTDEEIVEALIGKTLR